MTKKLLRKWILHGKVVTLWNDFDFVVTHTVIVSKERTEAVDSWLLPKVSRQTPGIKCVQHVGVGFTLPSLFRRKRI